MYLHKNTSIFKPADILSGFRITGHFVPFAGLLGFVSRPCLPAPCQLSRVPILGTMLFLCQHTLLLLSSSRHPLD